MRKALELVETVGAMRASEFASLMLLVVLPLAWILGFSAVALADVVAHGPRMIIVSDTNTDNTAHININTDTVAALNAGPTTTNTDTDTVAALNAGPTTNINIANTAIRAEQLERLAETRRAAARTDMAFLITTDVLLLHEVMGAVRANLRASVDVRQHHKSGDLESEIYSYADGTESLIVSYHRNSVPEWLHIFDADGTRRWTLHLDQNGSVQLIRAFDANGTRIVDPN